MKPAKIVFGILFLLFALAGCGGGGGGGGSSDPPIDNNVAPVARFVWTNNPTGGANSFSFDATTSTDADGSIASYTWDFGDGGTATGATTTHTYAASGKYSVTLRVTDNSGALSLPATSDVDASSKPPVARFTISPAFANSRTITLNASTSTDPNNDIATYTWKFGDGATGSGRIVTRDYRNPGGQFNVELTVTDSQGQSAVTTQTVTITPIRILPLGDSITQGQTTASASGFAYRVALWKKLLDAKVAFEFVGSLNSNFSSATDGGTHTVDNEVPYSFNAIPHEGHWGWTANQVLADVTTWWSGYATKPDVVLILLGTNDLLSASITAEGAASNVRNVVNVLPGLANADGKSLVYLVAKIPPVNAVTYPNATTEKISIFNDSISGFPNALGFASTQMRIVDMNADLTFESDTYDGIHPNTAGEEKIAMKWFNELKAIYGF
ncbi:MAG: PKD domain-containing protein [Thiotrichales bacterium]